MSRKNIVSSSINFVTTVVYVSILLNLAIAAKPRGFSMKMIRSDSKESPLHPRYANLTQAERFRGLVEQSKARVRHLGSARAAAYNKSSSMNPDVVPVKFLEDRYFYIGKVGIGNFKRKRPSFKNFYLIIDTGSDLIWTQCYGGDNYFYQDRELYDQEGSSTYERIPCDNLPECDDAHCEDGFCTYRERYASGSETFGHLAYERFIMRSIHGGDGEYEGLENIIMGCGIDQRNFGPSFGVPEIREGDHDFPPPIPLPGTAPIAGILGLGQGNSKFSLILQLVGIDKQFEYCLESYDFIGTGISHTYLRFGEDTIIGEEPGEVLTTPIIQDPNFGTPYYLNLLDISVNNKSLGFVKSDFEIRGDGTGGTVIDSGTPFTVMIRRHYERVEAAVLAYFAGFDIHPADPKPGFGPCFLIPDDFREFPTMTFHFEGADFVIKKMSGIFALFEDNLLCLGIVSMPEAAEGDYRYAVNLGAMQQSNKRIMYDLDVKALSFTEKDCNFGS